MGLPCSLPFTNETPPQQTVSTDITNEKVGMLIYYAREYPNKMVCYHASVMQLNIDSDAAYLVLPKARSRGAGHFHLGEKLKNMTAVPNTKPNGPVLTECV